MSTYDDEEWQPPTAAEQAVLESQRKRRDAISKRIGDCLLLGYTMLSRSCPKCNVR
jgi:hypothetical protein